MSARTVVLLITAFFASASHASVKASRRAAHSRSPSAKPNISKKHCGFLPENSLRIPENIPQNLPHAADPAESNAPSSRGLGEAEFNDVLEKIQSVYGRVIEETGKSLLVRANWKDPKVNAYATLDDDDNPVVVAPGGMARHPLMTRDGLTAVFCHEVGHFLGGAPKAPRGQSGKLSWSSAEGQADYFASAKCMKMIFSDEAENAAVVKALHIDNNASIRERCDSFQCMRILAASEAATRVFAAASGHSNLPSVAQNDNSVVDSLVFSHPSPQCRLDTLVSGAKCNVPAEVGFDNQDPKVGACVGSSKPLEGDRPRCWFILGQ